MSYIDELNESQRQAVLYNDGPSLVIAGAGSGKTRVLTYKIAYLMEQGYEPWSILALTFTNKAAKEMKKRIALQVGNKAKYLWMGTFHSIFSRILRTEASYIGFNSNFTIYDSSDSKSLIKSIIKELKLDDKVYKPGVVQSRISRAKNHLILPEAYAVDNEIHQSDINAKVPAMRDIYKYYWERCKQSDAMDFDDLLVYTYLLFEHNPAIKEKYSNAFKYVLVDEYQDTNFAQHKIVLQLTSKHQHVCVVGDDAQSIYSFRGANIQNILKFTQIYNNAKLFKLEQNYRSTQTIVSAANSLIDKNTEQIKKDVFSKKTEGEPIQVLSAYSDVEEGEIVANMIGKYRYKNDCSYNDFAILYRTNAQSRIFEEVMRKKSIPYKIYGGLSFYQRKEIKDIISYFRLSVNQNDEEAFKRIINYPARGIGDTTLGKIISSAVNSHVSLWNVLESPLEYGLSLNKGITAKLQGFRDLISSFSEATVEKNAYEVGMMIVKGSGIMAEMYQSSDPEVLSRKENIEELINGMNDFCQTRIEEGNENIKLTDYLSEISLLTDQDNEKDDDGEKVTLMTIHSAKGLEFKNVFVVGMEENLFPSAMSLGSYKELEEERRLFYVAITRAEDNCFLSFAKSRFKYGKMEFSTPSRFLKDINPQYLSLPQQVTITSKIESESSRFREQRDNVIPRKTNHVFEKKEIITPVTQRHLKKVTRIPVSSSQPVSVTSGGGVSVGQRIEHERFGFGEIMKIEGAGENCKATVKFENAGEKQLLLKFARFKIVE